jgi:hypothetical protein
VAIVLVFVTGLGKLWWVSRKTRKQEVKDEEKRARIQELRKSGIIVESKGNDIPFGVRALESGMEIDGIWVSRSTTPIPESLRGLRSSESSFSPSAGSRRVSLSSAATSPRTIPYFGTPLSVSQQNQGSFVRVALSEISPASRHSRSLSGNLAAAYKPRCSSHLRFSSYGDVQFHEETLSQLEGSHMQSPLQSHGLPTHASSIAANSPPSSSTTAPDNDCYYSSSSESEGAVSCKTPKDRSHELQWASSQDIGLAESKDEGFATDNAEYTIGTRVRRNKGDYVPVQPGSPPRKISDPFKTPNASPVLAPTPGTSTRESRNEDHILGEAQWPLLSRDYPESPERPRLRVVDIHANKTVRKVNSGFEILPAGTFSAPIERFPEGFGNPYTTERPQTGGQSQTNDKHRTTRKLQKKPRDSLTGKRKSKGTESS